MINQDQDRKNKIQDHEVPKIKMNRMIIKMMKIKKIKKMINKIKKKMMMMTNGEMKMKTNKMILMKKKKGYLLVKLSSKIYRNHQLVARKKKLKILMQLVKMMLKQDMSFKMNLTEHILDSIQKVGICIVGFLLIL